MQTHFYPAIAAAFLLSAGVSLGQPAADHDWPQFRGLQNSGVGQGNPPVRWDVSNGQNILWKIDLAGLAHSCPIVSGDRVFVTTAVSLQNNAAATPTGFLKGTGESAKESGAWRWQVACYDLKTGVEIWRRTVAKGEPKIKRHLKATHANSTPAADDRRVVAFFGSEGLYCLNHEGDLLWKKDLGRLHSGPYDAPKLEWGFGSSPIIHQGKVILQCDCLNTGFVAIFDIQDGREIRRIPRQDVASWTTPLVIETATETQLVCNGYKQMAGYDLETGKRLWTLHGGGDVPIPAPLTAHGMLLLSSGHRRNSVYAVSPTARGEITPKPDSEPPQGIVWWEPRGGAYIPTPIIVGDHLYTCSASGVLTVRQAKTGKQVYAKRIGGMYSASAVATKTRLYFCREDGRVMVVKTGPEYELLAENDLGEPIFATPAISKDRLLIRTASRLYCIGEAKTP